MTENSCHLVLRAIIEGIDGENFPEVTSSAILLSRSAIARKHYCKAEDIRFERDRFGLKYICNMMSEKGSAALDLEGTLIIVTLLQEHTTISCSPSIPLSLQ